MTCVCQGKDTKSDHRDRSKCEGERLTTVQNSQLAGTPTMVTCASPGVTGSIAGIGFYQLYQDHHSIYMCLMVYCGKGGEVHII